VTRNRLRKAARHDRRLGSMAGRSTVERWGRPVFVGLFLLGPYRPAMKKSQN
jgi:hypothetical protein